MSKKSLQAAIQRVLQASGVAGAGIALGCLAPPAAAQSTAPATKQKPQTLQTIVVTGSHIRRVDLETSNPVVAITAQQIEATGKLTMGDVIQNLSVISGGIENPNVNNGGVSSFAEGSAGTGGTSVGLRGLGPSRTLVLVDGQRMPTIQGLADLNFIPVQAVERVEVLTDGASAVYGSDAIGGVINIILKSNYQGAQFQGNYGISDHDDGERRGGSFTFGQTSDKGSILAGVSFQQFDQVEQSARKFSENALSLVQTNNGGVTTAIGGSTFAARDYIQVPGVVAQCGVGGALSLNQGAFDAGTSPTTPADYHCFQQSDKYNYASVNLLMIPQERTNAFFKGVYHLSDNVDAFATVIEQKTVSDFQLAPQVTEPLLGLNIAANSYYNPFGVPFEGTTNQIKLRLFPVGNRSQHFATTRDMVNLGLRGNFNVLDENWTWDVGFNYGHISRIQTTIGAANLSLLNAGLGPSFLDTATGQVVCGTPGNITPNCTPWDPFNLNSPSAQSVLKTASQEAEASSNLYYMQKIAYADFSGGLFELPAGTAQLAMGVDQNKQYTNSVVPPELVENIAILNCPLGTLCTAPMQGGYSVKEAYAELFIPILKDMPFAKALNLTLGDRYSKYNDVGSTNNWKVALEYRPIDDLLLRGTVTSVFRAPTVAEIYAAPVSSAPFLSFDPCAFNAPTPTTPNPNAGNPACKGVPATGTFVNDNVAGRTQLTSVVSGAQYAGVNLKPESGKTFDVGAVYSPHYIPGLSASVDFWRVYLNDTITTPTVTTELLLCFYGQTKYCPYLPRIQSGSQAGQPAIWRQFSDNLGRVDTKGLDFSLSYKLPAFSFGQFNIDLNATYLTQFKMQTAPGEVGNLTINGAGMEGTFGSLLGSTCVSAGAMCFYPRVKATGTLNWQLGPWDAQWTMHYYSHYKAGSADPSQFASMLSTPLYVIHYGSYVLNDLQVGYNIEPLNTRIDVGVDNVMGKQPPIFYAGNVLNANTDTSTFDVLGRYYWARVTVNF